eukprot:4271878-Lingulodinium_polyedra.AAC.1
MRFLPQALLPATPGIFPRGKFLGAIEGLDFVRRLEAVHGLLAPLCERWDKLATARAAPNPSTGQLADSNGNAGGGPDTAVVAGAAGHDELPGSAVPAEAWRAAQDGARQIAKASFLDLDFGTRVALLRRALEAEQMAMQDL